MWVHLPIFPCDKKFISTGGKTWRMFPIVYSAKELLYWQIAPICKLFPEKLRTFPKVDINFLLRLVSSCKVLNDTTACSRKCWNSCSCKVEVRRVEKSWKTYPPSCTVSCSSDGKVLNNNLTREKRSHSVRRKNRKKSNKNTVQVVRGKINMSTSIISNHRDGV